MTTDTLTAEPWSGRVLCTEPPGHPAWLKAHEKKLGGHDVACIMGAGRKTPLQLWAEITGKVEREDISKLPWVRRGNALEPVVAGLYTECSGNALLPSPGLVQDAEIPFLAGTPDRLVVVPGKPLGVFEAKTFGFYKRREWEAEGIPMAYEAQIQFYMRILNLDWCCIAAMPIDDKRFDEDDQPVIWRDVARDPVIEAFMIDEVGRFWDDHVIPDIPPPAMQDDLSVLKRMHKRETTGLVVELDAVAQELIMEKEQIRRDVRALESREAEIKAWLMQSIGAAQFGLLPDGRAVRFALEKYGAREAGESRVLRIVKSVK